MHQPKTELARGMLLQVLEAGIQPRWVTGDAVYGDSDRLRASLEEQNQPYVLAVSGKPTSGMVGLNARCETC